MNANWNCVRIARVGMTDDGVITITVEAVAPPMNNRDDTAATNGDDEALPKHGRARYKQADNFIGLIPK